jgi:uncharacterized protein YjbI with pentapeptide repeats
MLYQFTKHDSCQKGIVYGAEFLPNSLQNKHFIDCTFDKTNFSGVRACNVSLENCILKQCVIANSNFKFSDLTDTKLYIMGMASSFDSSDFSNATLCNSQFEGCSFSEAYFFNTQLLNTRFIHSEFEGAIFKRTYLEDLDLSKTTLDFAEFSQAGFNKVVFPYWSTLHITKGFSDILSGNDIYFSTSDGTHCINQTQYIEEIRLLIPYFSDVGDFLALTNIFILEGEIKKAYNSIIRGLKDAAKYSHFKLLKYLCRMASLVGLFSKQELHNFYNTIEENFLIHSLSYNEYKNYLQELDSAKRMLIDKPPERDSISISIQTTIPQDDYKRLSETIRIIDAIILETSPNAICHFEIRHNSPIELVIQAADAIIALLPMFATIEYVLNKSTTYIERLQKIIINQKQLKKNKTDNATIEQLYNQVENLKEKIDNIQKGNHGNHELLALPGTDEYNRISYTLSNSYDIPQSLRTYRTEKKDKI